MDILNLSDGKTPYKSGVDGMYSHEDKAYGLAQQLTTHQAAMAKRIVDEAFANHQHQYAPEILAAVMHSLAANFAALLAARKS